MSRYHMVSKGMYVTELEFSMKEYVSMNQELSQTASRSTRIQEIKVSSGRSKAIKFNEFDVTDNFLMIELKTLGYERESVTDLLGNHPTDWDASPHSESECGDIDE